MFVQDRNWPVDLKSDHIFSACRTVEGIRTSQNSFKNTAVSVSCGNQFFRIQRGWRIAD